MRPLFFSKKTLGLVKKSLNLYYGLMSLTRFNIKLQYIMIRNTKKSRKYQAPYALETHLALERNICSVVFNVQVQELENINQLRETNSDYDEPLYFEF